jgi:N-acetylglucosamine-6-sulfatase
VAVHRPSRRTVSAGVAILTVVVIVAGLVGANALADRTRRTTSQQAVLTTNSKPTLGAGPITTTGSKIRNVVLVLADDLDWKLWNDVPRLRALQGQGMTFTNYVVSDSLCCPSRTTIFRGQYVHNHQVVSNDSVTGGGWPTFRDKGYPTDCLPTWLHSDGVYTGLVGKYLNEFPQTLAEATVKQPGWDTFVVPYTNAAAYAGYDYTLDDNGVVQQYGSTPQDFLNDVLNRKAVEFLASAPDRFFLELSSLTPHLPSPVAPRHAGSHAFTAVPRDPAFDSPITNPPSWLASLQPFGPKAVRRMDQLWQQRAESAESFADSVQVVMDELKRTGHDKDTLVLVTSDNGFHVGSYRSKQGKRTAFDTDTVVPLVAIGPGVPKGTVVDAMTSETDVAPTITTLLGVDAPAWVDGQSIAGYFDPSMQPFGAQPNTRTAALSESLGIAGPGDPDFEPSAPPGFTALRTKEWLYVESLLGEKELYNRIADRYELNNIIDTAPASTVLALQRQFTAMQQCAGDTCRVADSMPVPTSVSR